eukprot:gb/GECH01006607.1/.p1 GENE.gb/GECH01006607.1/~~gb/GECH01006607.1/.p1  ORF type:complete len:371 (+),score=81.98 gb/GECH01006607.1/:1-1113(+)
MSSSTVLHINKTLVDNQELSTQARYLCLQMVPEFEKPEDVKVSTLTGGITNKLFKCTSNGTSVLVRIYGKNTELLINREKELRLMQGVHAKGLGPRLYGTFNNGYVYQYFPGEVYSPEDMRNNANKVARHLALWHSLDITGEDRTPSLFHTLRSWLKTARNLRFEDESKQKLLESLKLSELVEEIDTLEKSVSDAPVVFCHNDLLAGNIIEDKTNTDHPTPSNNDSNSMHSQLYFIDFEYCSYNFRDFDIANHFCEYSGFDNLTEHYPSVEHQIGFFQRYLRASKQYAQKCDESVSHDEIRQMFLNVGKFTLASHLYWGLWATAQACFSDIDFDFMSYAAARIDLYRQQKDEMLSLQSPSESIIASIVDS